MALNLQDKQAIVAEVSESAKGALSAVVADARGVTVGKMTQLRKEARAAGVDMRIVRNTLLRRALEDTNYTVLNDVFVGPTLIAFSTEHPGAAARLFKEFAKTNDKFEIKGAAAPLISNLSFVLANSLNKRAAAPGCSVENAISVGPTNTSFNTV